MLLNDGTDLDNHCKDYATRTYLLYVFLAGFTYDGIFDSSLAVPATQKLILRKFSFSQQIVEEYVMSCMFDMLKHHCSHLQDFELADHSNGPFINFNPFFLHGRWPTKAIPPVHLCRGSRYQNLLYHHVILPSSSKFRAFISTQRRRLRHSIARITGLTIGTSR